MTGKNGEESWETKEGKTCNCWGRTAVWKAPTPLTAGA